LGLYSNNSANQQGLVENNPDYGKYITITSTDKPYNYTNIINNSKGLNPLNGIAKSIGATLNNTFEAVNNTLGKGISTIMNLGNNNKK
jgi:hypothetical protein